MISCPSNLGDATSHHGTYRLKSQLLILWPYYYLLRPKSGMNMAADELSWIHKFSLDTYPTKRCKQLFAHIETAGHAGHLINTSYFMWMKGYGMYVRVMTTNLM